MKQHWIIPEQYPNPLGVRDTLNAIKQLKDYFEHELSGALHLTRVSAPLIVSQHSGLNDDLSGVERPVAFDLLNIPGVNAQIVQSLAKWKRMALAKYEFTPGEGLYTDMNAIRRDDDMDNLHSVYVDQWDWERVITRQERTLDFLQKIVRRIFSVFHGAQAYITGLYTELEKFVPEDVAFITAQELEDRYPDLTPVERENAYAREKGAIFVMQIGGKLRSGEVHGTRAPDYDDWSLNGDLIFWYPILGCAVELSSMGIRVDEAALLRQLEEAGCPERGALPFHQSLLQGKLPLTIGGGIGQSRICMVLLNKAHVGEVQASLWPGEQAESCYQAGIRLL